MNNKNQNTLIFTVLVVTILIFSSWDLLQWILGANQWYGTVLVSLSEFKSIHSWIPLIKAVQLGNMFPSQPGIDISTQAFLFYPYITLWVYGLMSLLFSIKGVVIVSTVVFPTLSFYLLYRYFYRQLNEFWSLAISLTCIFAFTDWPFRSFLGGIVKGLPISELTIIQPKEIAHYSIPSLAIFVFLLIF